MTGPLLVWLESPDDQPDYPNAVAREVVRGRFEGTRAVAVAGTVKPRQQITALLDLLDLHLSAEFPLYEGQWIDPAVVTVLIGPAKSQRAGTETEAMQALRTLVAAIVDGPRVQLLAAHGTDLLEPAPGFTDVSDPVRAGWTKWPAQLAAADGPAPAHAVALVTEVGHAGLRLHPLLSSPAWSLRLDGIEVGRLTEDGGWLEVDADGAAGAAPGKESLERSVWLSCTGGVARVERSAAVLQQFVLAWEGSSQQPGERSLRAAVQQGLVLSPLTPDPVVVRGAGFPTKWGLAGQAHYVDAVLRDGRTPWVVEVAAQKGVGVGQRIRHAIADAVLGRDFVHQATALDGWFTGHDLDRTACQAAVVIPEPEPANQHWEPRMRALGAVFGVDLVVVPAVH